MRRARSKPPPTLAGARVIEYAILDETVSYCGHSGLFVGGKELGPVPCLAICQGLKDSAVLLLHCDLDWTVLGTAEYATTSEARERAERIYPGVSNRWIEAAVPELEASNHIEVLWEDLRCKFCGKGPDDVARLIKKRGVQICGSCVTEFYQMLHDSTEEERTGDH
jgi:hypothetical protein